MTLADRLVGAEGTPLCLVEIAPLSPEEVILISLWGPHHVYLSDGLWSHNISKYPYWPSPPSGPP